MITMDLKSLIKKMNNTTRNPLKGAAGLCLSRTHYNLDAEHWQIKLLELDDSDLPSLLKSIDLTPETLSERLNRGLDSIKAGSSRPRALAPNVVELAKQAWVLASIEYGHNTVTSAHLFAAMMLEDNLRRSAVASCPPLRDIPPESIRSLVPAIVGTTSE